MFDSSSRYRDCSDARLTLDDGTVITYRTQRIIPAITDLRLVGTTRVAPHERLDQVTARVLGDPTQFWQLCDANGALDPLDLLAEAGGTLRTAAPAFRTNRWR
jgi:hypothetical protein